MMRRVGLLAAAAALLSLPGSAQQSLITTYSGTNGIDTPLIRRFNMAPSGGGGGGGSCANGELDGSVDGCLPALLMLGA